MAPVGGEAGQVWTSQGSGAGKWANAIKSVELKYDDNGDLILSVNGVSAAALKTYRTTRIVQKNCRGHLVVPSNDILGRYQTYAINTDSNVPGSESEYVLGTTTIYNRVSSTYPPKYSTYTGEGAYAMRISDQDILKYSNDYGNNPQAFTGSDDFIIDVKLYVPCAESQVLPIATVRYKYEGGVGSFTEVISRENPHAKVCATGNYSWSYGLWVWYIALLNTFRFIN